MRSFKPKFLSVHAWKGKEWRYVIGSGVPGFDSWQVVRGSDGIHSGHVEHVLKRKQRVERLRNVNWLGLVKKYCEIRHGRPFEARSLYSRRFCSLVHLQDFWGATFQRRRLVPGMGTLWEKNSTSRSSSLLVGGVSVGIPGDPCCIINTACIGLGIEIAVDRWVCKMSAIPWTAGPP